MGANDQTSKARQSKAKAKASHTSQASWASGARQDNTIRYKNTTKSTLLTEKHIENTIYFLWNSRSKAIDPPYPLLQSWLLKYVFFIIFSSIFRAFGVHFGGPGAPLASFWPLGAPRAIQDLIFSLFFRLLHRFGNPRGAQRSPKERKGDQNGAQSAP